jgi:UDP-N-acetylmuramoyl-tripeptide--D-alanyl-D-alanine ligase
VSVTIPPHRGAVTTRALIDSIGAPTGSVVVDPDESTATVELDGVVRTVGFSSAADYTATDVRTSAEGTSFSVRNSEVHLRLVGERHVVPALAALALAVETGMPLEDAIARVEAVASLEPGNLEIVRAGDVLVIDDSSDTTFRSTVEALKTVAEIAGESRRSIAVLAPLDAASLDPLDIRDEHDRLGRIVVRLNIGQLVVVGDAGRHLSTAAGLEGSWDGESLLVASADAAYDVVRADIREGDVVLVKVPGLASRLVEVAS